MPSLRRRPPAPGAPDRATARSRRRFARRQWRRRWLAWRVVLALVVVLGLVGLGVYALYFSTWLAVTRVEVSGAESLGTDQVLKRAAVEQGEQLARIDLAAVERRVGSLASVGSVEVTRQWPHAISISIKERQAIAVVEIGGRLRGMDRSGAVFGDYRAAPAGLPRVETSIGTASAPLAEAAAVVAALPEDLRAQVDHVQVETVDEISLVLTDGRVVVWGSADQSATKAQVLAPLLAAVKATTYDVSVPAKPTTN